MSDTIFNKDDFNNIFGTSTITQIKPDPRVRNAVLEEVAQEFDSMRIAFGDTAHSFAQYVRDMKT
jgi:hypothetical protein